MRTYGQYCPIARISELLAERWTPIIIRNLLAGCRTFGELLDGAPGISKALLAQRLELLADHGILTRQPGPSGRGGHYTLTDKGQALKAITDSMGAWGARWLELQPQHIDAAYVLWRPARWSTPPRSQSRGWSRALTLPTGPRSAIGSCCVSPRRRSARPIRAASRT